MSISETVFLMVKPCFALILLGFFTFLSTGCNNQNTQPANENYLPSLEEIDSLQKRNVAGTPVNDPETVFDEMGKYPIVGFGHYHDKADNFRVFRRMIPKFREKGILLLAIEIPASKQSLIDSIMDENTPQDKTIELLDKLNYMFKEGDNRSYNLDPKIIHPLTDIVLDWLNSGGIVAAIDVPYIYDPQMRMNIYQTEIMYKAIKDNSIELYNAVKDVNINQLDDDKDLRIISEVRSAYMASVLNSYRLQGIKSVAFLGYNHILLKVKPTKTVSGSIPQISKNYFNQSVFSLYPYASIQPHIFYKGHESLGHYGYGTKD